MNKAREKAKAFLKEYQLDQVTLEEIRRTLTGQGYTIVTFNHLVNDEPVAALIEALSLEEAVRKSRGFTYADQNHRLVFVHEDLSEEEERLVLVHEEGHIYCDHFSSLPVIGRDVAQEHEANEFTHYILNPTAGRKLGRLIKKRKAGLLLAAAVLVLAVVGLLLLPDRQQPQTAIAEYYLTASGDKYHEQECIFIKNKTNVRQMTREELESGDYTPCGICLPPVENPEEG